MNCPLVRNLLLQSEDPAAPGDDLAAHLAGCSACRQWQSRLLRLERLTAELPVPDSAGARLALLEKVRAGVPFADLVKQAEIRVTLPFRPRPPRPAWQRRSFAALAGAAAVLLLALGVWSARRPGVSPAPELARQAVPRDLLVEHVVARDLTLAEASTAGERVSALADLADDLHQAMRQLLHAASVEQLSRLARLYDRVVREGVAEQARTVGGADRYAVLGPVAGRLARTREDAEKMARNVPAFADPLRLVAQAASMAGRDLPSPRTMPVLSEAPPARPVDAERLALLERNFALIEGLVEGGVNLAHTGLEDPTGRASVCDRLVALFAGEVASAIDRSEPGRAAEFGDHLRGLLTRGVANNLVTARQRVAAGSSVDLKICRVGQHVIEVIDPVERRLASATRNDDVDHTLTALRGGRDDVRKAIGPAGRA